MEDTSHTRELQKEMEKYIAELEQFEKTVQDNTQD